MPKTVLSVGQCRPDHAAISHFLTSHFDVEILTADYATDCMQMVAEKSIDLVLINRKLDADYSDGMEIVKSIKSRPESQDLPVMLVSNFEESQQQAVSEGASYGFGKAELNNPETVSRLKSVLAV